MRGNGATLVQVGADTFQILPLENAPANAEVAPVGGRAPTVRPGYGITVVPLRNVSSTAAAQFIQPLVSTPEDIRIDASRNLLLFAGTHSERQSVVDMLADLDVNWLADKSIGIFPLRVSTPEAVIPELQTIFGSLDPNTTDTTLVRFVPVARLNAVLAVGTNPGQIEEVERWVARLDRGRTVGTQFYVYNLKHAVAEDVAKMINDVYSEGPAGGGGETGFGPAPVGPASLAPDSQDSSDSDDSGDGDDGSGRPTQASASASPSPTLPGGIKVVANKANNSLLIRATPASFETMESTLLRLDIAPLQVLIEATIAEVLLNNALRYGVQYFIKNEGIAFGFNSGAQASGDSGIDPLAIIPGFNFLYTGGNSNVTIDALSRVTDVKVLSSPSVVVQDNREATLTVGDEVPITTRQAVSVEDVDAPVVNSIEYRNTGVILQVRPRINVDGAVSLDIAQEVSRVADAAQAATGDLTPTITQRKITSRVAVQSGQTVVLGGLIEDAETRNRDRVPVLGEIPVVGSLFGSTNITNRRTELIVFITPRVIRNAQDAGDVSDELRARLRSLRPLSPQAALPPVPQPMAPLPSQEPVPVPVPAPAGPQPVVPPGTFGQAPAAISPEWARQARQQGVPEEWLPDLVGAGPPAASAEREVEVPPAPVVQPPPVPEQREAAAPPEPPPLGRRSSSRPWHRRSCNLRRRPRPSRSRQWQRSCRHHLRRPRHPNPDPPCRRHGPQPARPRFRPRSRCCSLRHRPGRWRCRVRRRATASTSPGRPCRASARPPSPRHPVPRWRRSVPPRHPSSGSEPIGQALGQLALGLVLGSCIGSFVGTLALRAPEDWAALARGRSACPACGTRLKAADLVPLLSYLARGGRCRFCAAPISAYYPAVELTAAIIGAACFVLLPPAEALLAAMLGWWLLALALIDLRCFLLPDPLTLPLVLAGLALAASGWSMQAPDVADSSLGALTGFLGLYGLGLVYRAVRHREGLGLGDAKLAAAAGAWLGWQPLPTLLLLAALVTLAAALALRAPMRGDTALPLGPGLAAAFFALYLWPAVG